MKSVLVVMALVVAGAQGWWCTGHMTVAYIAKQTLSPTASDKVSSMAEALSSMGPFPKSPDFMQMGCWADDLKSEHLEAMESWHFINLPYDPSNYPIARWPVQKENVESVIMQLDETLKARYASSTPTWNLLFALGNLVHFYGDIHQPLHATEMFSAQYPTGDAGGNAQSVTVDGVTTKLHFIWDSVCWEYNKELRRPLSSTDRGTVTSFGDYLMNTYTFSDSQKKEYNSTVFAMESLQDAITYAYPGTSDGMTISAQYLARCKPVAEGRVALAGYRLGSQLEYLFGSGSASLGHDVSSDEGKTKMAEAIRRHILRSHIELGNAYHHHMTTRKQ